MNDKGTVDKILDHQKETKLVLEKIIEYSFLNQSQILANLIENFNNMLNYFSIFFGDNNYFINSKIFLGSSKKN